MKICYLLDEMEIQNLELFIDIIDAQLFETVGFKNLKAVDIENTDCIGDLSTGTHGCVDSLDNPIKEFVINGFGKSVSNGSCLRDVERDLIY